MSTNAELQRLAARVGRHLLNRRRRLATAESCTGGWIAKAITDVPGSSQWFDAAYVTYSNAAKVRTLSVKRRTLARYGAVSEAVVREMARGALRTSRADIAVAVSGVAGPDGGTPDKPVGLVWLCWGWRRGRVTQLETRRVQLRGNRAAVRSQSVALALQGLLRP
jgi:nicotinamide-nucleotide amidase